MNEIEIDRENENDAIKQMNRLADIMKGYMLEGPDVFIKNWNDPEKIEFFTKRIEENYLSGITAKSDEKEMEKLWMDTALSYFVIWSMVRKMMLTKDIAKHII